MAFVIVGMIVESLSDIANVTPFTIFGPLAPPVLALTKDLEMGSGPVLNIPGRIDLSCSTIDFGSRVGFAGIHWIIKGRDPFLQQSLQFFQLPRMDPDRIFHHSPVIRSLTGIWLEITIAGGDGLSA